MAKNHNTNNSPHVLLFPYPSSQGHINPIIQFGRRLLSKGVKPTLVTTIHLFNSTLPHNTTTSIEIEPISDGFDEGGFASAETTESYLKTFKETGSKSLSDLIKKVHSEGHKIDAKLGVFVPASEQNSEEPAVTCTTEETVLDEKAFFRPQENLATKLLINNHLRRSTAAHPSICSSAVSTARRKLHESAYEKEVEEEADVNVEVEEMSHQAEEEYWEPDPDTGVFVPASEQNSEEPAVSCTTEETVLDEKAFFRPQEDLEPPSTESFTGEIPPVDPFAE